MDKISREEVAASLAGTATGAPAVNPAVDATPAKFSREDVAASLPRPAAPAPSELAFALGNGRFSISTNPKEGGYVLFGQDANNPAKRATLRFADVAQLPELLSDPANEAFLLLVVGFMSPAATKSVRQFIDTVETKIGAAAPASAAEVIQEGAAGWGAGTGIDPEKYYFVSLDAKTQRRTVNPKLGSLLKESAISLGRLTGSAEKSGANRHDINVLTGGQVLQEGIELE